ncbi:MAG: cytidine deaminase [Candidatus Cloacimonadaceae bacterium]|nr:cytidine deaminase [Candidatus Cloacimonadaceae bacterium]MDP3115152.1 cytidine deaminase [Candidatus Cloacimonadaceae bacterium]
MLELSATLTELLERAKHAASHSYSPYSGYKVGSAVLTVDGQIFEACNVENASYSLSLCAERNAIFKAVSAGKRDFEAIAIYVDADEPFPPCGACRQVMAEFNPSITVVYANRSQTVKTDLAQLLPGAFCLKK